MGNNIIKSENNIIKDENSDDHLSKNLKENLDINLDDLINQDQSIQEAFSDLKKYLNAMMKQKQELEINQIIRINTQILQLSDINEAQIEGSANEQEDIQIKINNIAQILKRRGHELVKFIGKGSFGTIFLCKLSSNGLRYVIKAQRPFSNDPKQHQQFLVELAFEIEALSTFIDCKNVVQYLGHEIDVESHYSFIKLQECKGTLQDILNMNKQINEESFIKYAKDIIKGIEEVHLKNFVIQDLKPENIFIDLNDIALIGDLGFSKKLKEGKSNLSIAQGNFSYFAPEQLPMYIADMQQFGIKQNNSHLSSDIYSFGLILYRLLCKKDQDIFERFQTKCQVDPQNLIELFKFKNEIREIIKKCTSFNPYERPTASEVSQLLQKLYTQIFIREYEDVNLLMKFQKYANYFSIKELVQNSQSTIIPVISEQLIQEYIHKQIPNQVYLTLKNSLFKINLVGARYAGKSAHLNSIVRSNYLYSNQATIGVEFVTVQFQVDDFTTNLQIWDTSGYRNFHQSIIKNISKGSSGFLLYLTDDIQSEQIDYIERVLKILNEEKLLAKRNCQIVFVKKIEFPTLEKQKEISQQIKRLQELGSEKNIILDDPIEVYLPTNYNSIKPLENIIRNILKYGFGYEAQKIQKI